MAASFGKVPIKLKAKPPLQISILKTMFHQNQEIILL